MGLRETEAMHRTYQRDNQARNDMISKQRAAGSIADDRETLISPCLLTPEGMILAMAGAQKFRTALTAYDHAALHHAGSTNGRHNQTHQLA